MAQTTNFLTPINNNFPYKSVYSTLKQSQDQHFSDGHDFRVVRILPSSGNNVIRCELVASTLASGVAYEALSYCAGDPTDCRNIMLNGFPFNTYHTMYEALEQFRLHNADRLFWIDQICINQTDTDERDSQVLLMRQIYQHAIRTHIWLGKELSQPASHAAFELLHDFLSVNRASLRRYILQDGPERQRHDMETYVDVRGEPPFIADPVRDYLHAEERWWYYFQPSEPDTKQARAIQCQNDPALSKSSEWLSTAARDPKYDDGWTALLDLFVRPWWQRCWVVQEATASSDLHVVCGADSIAWEDLGLFLDLWSILSYLKPQTFIHYDHLDYYILVCREKFSTINSLRGSPIVLTLGSCLVQQHGSRATDPRDKVYAMLGLFQVFADRYAIRPSYAPSNTMVDVYTAAMRANVTVDHDINLLNLVTGHEFEAGLPSWVPHWNKPRQNQVAMNLERFEAGMSYQTDLAIESDERVLRVRGWIIDTIDAVGLVDDSEDGSKVLGDWKSVHDSQDQAEFDLHTMDSFYRTLDFDQWAGQHPSPDGDAEAFRSYWNGTMDNWCTEATRDSRGARFFLSHDKRPGLAPGSAQVGQCIFLAHGGRSPWIVQRVERSRYSLVGPCYIHGVMRGEIQTLEQQGKVYVEDIYLI